MDKAYDKQDLNRFFSSIKSKYIIPHPDTNIPGKVTCRNGFEYIEKPYSMHGSNPTDVDDTRHESRLSRQHRYRACGHSSSVTNPYRSLGDIVLDPKKLTLKHFNSQIQERDAQELATAHLNKWKNATKVVFPIVRINQTISQRRGAFGDPDQDMVSARQHKQLRTRRQQFVVHHEDWPKIQSTGFAQLSSAVNKTNKRVSATRGMTPYFQVLDSVLHDTCSDESSDNGALEDTPITQPAAVDSIKRERVVKRLEAFIYVLNALFNIKNRDLRGKRPVQQDKERDVSVHNMSEERQSHSQTRERTFTEVSPIKGFTWNEGIPPWQKIKQENEFLAASVEKENEEREHKSPEAKDQEFLSGLREDFVAMQEKLDSHLNYRLGRILRDGREKFIRRFHALKHAPTLTLGMVEVRRVDRTSRVVDVENKKTSSKQEWYVAALNELEVKRYIDDGKVSVLLQHFERFSHSELQEEIKSLKAKLCYLTLSMPVYLVLQSDYQYAIRFIIQKCLAGQEDFFGSWFKMRFKKGSLTATT